MALTQTSEGGLQVSNNPTDGYFLQYKDSTDKLTWAAASATVADGSITEAKLNANAPTNDHVLTADSTAGSGFKWAAAPGGGSGMPTTGGTFTGNVTFQDAGEGINFTNNSAASGSGVTSSSRILDQFEEGTWTPGFSGFGSPTISTQVGSYVRVGRQVTCNFHIVWTGGTAASGARLTGLPFAVTAADGKQLEGYGFTSDCDGDACWNLKADTSTLTSVQTHPLTTSTYNDGYLRGTITMIIGL